MLEDNEVVLVTELIVVDDVEFTLSVVVVVESGGGSGIVVEVLVLTVVVLRVDVVVVFGAVVDVVLPGLFPSTVIEPLLTVTGRSFPSGSATEGLVIVKSAFPGGALAGISKLKFKTTPSPITF